NLGQQAAPLAAEDAAVYQEFLSTRSEAARQRTIELPLRMAELAAEVTEGAVGGDARVGALLADAAARAAALLVRANGGDESAAAPATGRAARAAARV